MDAPVSRGTRGAPVGTAFVILTVVVTTILAAFAFQAAGYAPCELCLKERLPYYAGVALAALTIPATRRGPSVAWRACFALLALLFLFSAGFGAYHAGVEWGFWAGPSDCTGSATHAASGADFLRQLHGIKVVRCDAVAIRILGLSLAGWNVVVSLAVAALAVAGLNSRG